MTGRKNPNGALTNTSCAWLTVRAFHSSFLTDCGIAAEDNFGQQHRSSWRAAALRGFVLGFLDFQDGCAHGQSLRVGCRVRAGARVLPHADSENSGGIGL